MYEIAGQAWLHTVMAAMTVYIFIHYMYISMNTLRFSGALFMWQDPWSLAKPHPAKVLVPWLYHNKPLGRSVSLQREKYKYINFGRQDSFGMH